MGFNSEFKGLRWYNIKTEKQASVKILVLSFLLLIMSKEDAFIQGEHKIFP